MERDPTEAPVTAVTSSDPTGMNCIARSKAGLIPEPKLRLLKYFSRRF